MSTQTPKQPGAKQGWRSKTARQIARAAVKAGATVERTAQGHLKVTGPDGRFAIIGSQPENNRGGRGVVQAVKTIEQRTGIKLDLT